MSKIKVLGYIEEVQSKPARAAAPEAAVTFEEAWTGEGARESHRHVQRSMVKRRDIKKYRLRDLK